MTAVSGELRNPVDVDRAIRKRRMDIVRDLGERCTLWLAAPPLWTRSAAETTGFPVERDESVTDFVRRARAAGWCKTRGSLRADGPTELRFWMPDEVRRDVLDTMRELARGDMRTVQSNARDVATSVVRHAGEVDLPGPLRAWAELCAEAEPDDIPTRLLDRVQEAVRVHDLGGAQELVNAGKALNAVVEGTADNQLTRARLMLDLGLERRRDDVVLSRYLDRPELSNAIADLLAPAAGKWALHLRGVGGVGKSMLIRYLRSGKFAEDRNLRPVPMACVNFDHVSPDYPARKPVQLLLELADELALYAADSDQAYQALRAFYDQADSAHQGLSSLRDGSPRPLDDDLGVRDAVDAFARVIGELGGGLLILDTCEELAKWNPGNLNSPAILATLEMVERLHGQVDSIRVLLAGRRPLPARGWLDERIVAGFTIAEAREYLALPGDRALPADLTDEIIRQSRAIDRPVPARGKLPTWVNPFDLALYRAWANEEPGLSVTDIARGNDAYVESRIVQRLYDDPLVMRSLPLLAAGGKCRVETIATALDCDAATLGRQLAAQEWIEAEGGAPPVFVTAWPAMAQRLRRYYDAPDHLAEFSQVMHWFAEVIRRRLGDDSVTPIDVDEVIVALRWAEPAEAAGLWDLVTAQVAQPPGQWGTVSAITVRILGLWDDEEEWPTTGALRAAVLAAHIAAYRRKMPLADVRELWEQVLTWASEHPDPARRRQLRALGALGGLPYAAGAASLWEILRAEQESLMSSPEVGTSAIDAVHRLLEMRRPDSARQLRELLDLEAFRSAFQGRSGVERANADRPLAWAYVADARLLADTDPPAARERLAAAERLASAASAAEWAWPHWIPPVDLLARVRIERGLIDKELIAAPSDLTTLDTWEDYAAGRLRSVDGERLASLCLRLRLRHGAVPASVAERWELAERQAHGQTVTNSAHDLVPPLFVSVAEAWLSAGWPERGLAVLERRGSEANAVLDDGATVWHADAGIIGLARRLRLTNQRSLLLRLTRPAEYESAPRERIGRLDDARRAWAVIYRESPPDARLATDRPAGWHAWWQCQSAQFSGSVFPVPWSPESLDADRPDLEDIRADLEERRRLGRRDAEQVQVQQQLEAFLARPEQASRRSLTPARSVDPYRGLRPELRLAALDPIRYPGQPSRAPVRLIAETAFEEAELLALRLPDAAAWVYWKAAEAYANCDDHLGRLLALVAFRDALSQCREDDQSSLLGALSARNAAAQHGLLRAWNAIVVGQPGLAAVLAGPPEDAGSWRYWAEAVQRNIGGLTPVIQAGTGSSPIASAEAPEATGTARDANKVMAIRRAVFRVLALPLAVVMVGRIRTAFRLAAECGVGAARIETLLFDATIGAAVPGEPGGLGEMVRLRVRLRPWRSAPVPAWLRLRLRAISLAVRWLKSGWPERTVGYSGFLVPEAASPDAGSISWTSPLDSPRGTWWDQQRPSPIAGTVRTSRNQTGQPWERLLAASLGPAAAGRIEWVRLAGDQVRAVHSGNLGAELMAAPAWSRPFAGYYRRPEPSLTAGVPELVSGLAGPASSGRPGPLVRHVIGRAVRTSAGPCMNVSGKSRAGRDAKLLAARDLTRGRPLVVVLQAEPADGEGAGAARRYDLADKLRLATDLLDDGVPAVLVLPALPARIAREVALIVTSYADTPGRSAEDVQVDLLRPLRAAITRQVEPAVLDDVILFLNARYA